MPCVSHKWVSGALPQISAVQLGSGSLELHSDRGLQRAGCAGGDG